ncbi:MAG TPA: hypothetical protein VEV84_00745, partial [Pyrinomonadaceae bacterium]|nr:hypothetical protein [Pyrinomonadaceae bacterium]
AHNAVRTAMQLALTNHPANLFPVTDPNAPQIVDPADDELGTTAQDIREGRFSYDPAANQLVYQLTVSDASVTVPNMRWTMTSTFGTTQIFVTAAVDETNTTSYSYGRITTLATGTPNQEDIGPVDSGSISGNVITIKLSLDKINAAVGSNVVGTRSTNTRADTQILIGTSITGGALLNSDNASGSDFQIGSGAPTPTPTPTASPTATPTPSATPEPTPVPSPTPDPNAGGRFDERYSGTLNPAQSAVTITFQLRRSMLDAQINQNHGDQTIYFDLLDTGGNLIATASQQKIHLDGLATGTYVYRVRGNVAKAVDFTIKSGQGN